MVVDGLSEGKPRTAGRRLGVAEFIGRIAMIGPGFWIGVAYDDPVGKNDAVAPVAPVLTPVPCTYHGSEHTGLASHCEKVSSIPKYGHYPRQSAPRLGKLRQWVHSMAALEGA